MNTIDPVAVLCAYHGETNPEQLVLRLCRELLQQCTTQSGPTPLPVLASCQGIREIIRKRIQPDSGCSGLLIPTDGGYKIAVNACEPVERQAFSIAHETVHTFFREACFCARPSRREEELCDLGAAELTMPAGRFAAHLATSRLTLAGIDSCRREFGVSFEAAARRAVGLTDEQACLFIAAPSRTMTQDRLGTGDPVLRIAKWRPSGSWPHQCSYRNSPVAPNSLIGQAFEHQDQRSGLARLGLPFDSGIYELEARGYTYARLGNPTYRQVISLARVPGRAA